jgi:AcrR family transcriptional regulator
MVVDKAAGRRMQKVRKSDRTRAAILNAAQKLFAEHGHERTTVRDIAAKASVDPALVIRYFGSKDELFVRAAAFDLKVPDLDKIKRLQIGETLMRRFLELGEGFTGMTVLLRPVFIGDFCGRQNHGRMLIEDKLAEGEELESNILQVGQRCPANLSVRRRRDWNVTRCHGSRERLLS